MTAGTPLACLLGSTLAPGQSCSSSFPGEPFKLVNPMMTLPSKNLHFLQATPLSPLSTWNSFHSQSPNFSTFATQNQHSFPNPLHSLPPLCLATCSLFCWGFLHHFVYLQGPAQTLPPPCGLPWFLWAEPEALSATHLWHRTQPRNRRSHHFVVVYVQEYLLALNLDITEHHNNNDNVTM